MADNGLCFHILVSGKIRIGTLHFRLAFQGGGEDTALEAAWLAEGDGISVGQLLQNLKDTPLQFEAPSAITDFDLALTKVGFDYFFQKKQFQFEIQAKKYGSLVISTSAVESGRQIEFCLQIATKFQLSKLPVIGDGLTASDTLQLAYFRISVLNGKVTPGAKIVLDAFHIHTEIELPESKSVALLPAGVSDTLADPAPVKVKWFDFNKDAGPVHLARLGFAMGDGCVTAYVDGGIRLSILLLEFLGLYLTIPFKKGKKVEFGISGLVVTVSRPPLTISGGLYLSESQGMSLYTGEVSIGFQKFQFTALGSYGQFSNGDPSLFIFLLITAPIGGPPIFYVTGLAGGFGYNRTIILPADVKDVGKFPFVQAAMQQGPLKKGMSPAQVLQAMNDSIQPQKGSFFASVGVRFTSFGLLDTFLLVNILFGNRFEISLLGLARASIPPKAVVDPVVYAELALKVVIAPDDGLVSVIGALTSASYVLTKDCKLHGGFAFVTWFGSNPHSGDFVLTLGGYKDGFRVPHYPAVDRIGVDWAIDSHLSLSAGCYFALTPSCIMLGGAMAINYENGRLKAWFNAHVEFFMQWKPYAYSFSVGISVGASFRWDFFPFFTTFKIELSASLNLWGPPFGGEAYVKWWVFSFTIFFGSSRPNPQPIPWSDFASSFLPEGSPAKQEFLAGGSGAAYLSVQATQGILRESSDGKERLVSAHYLKIEVTSRMPSTSVNFNSDTPMYQYTGNLGVVPMGVTSYTGTLQAEVLDAWNQKKELHVRVVLSSVPRALWDNHSPDPNSTDMLLSNVPIGLIIWCEEKQPECILPSLDKAYDIEILCENERLPVKAFSDAAASHIQPKFYPQEDRLGQIAATIQHNETRKTCLTALSQLFGVCTEDSLHLERWGAALDEQFYGVPDLQVLGAQERWM